MKKSEQAAVVRIIRHMQSLQQQVAKPTTDSATEEEVLKILELFWEWTEKPNQHLPSKHVIENLVGLMRGCAPGEYGYISSSRLAEIIRKAATETPKGSLLSVKLSDGWSDMSPAKLYAGGFWNYRETPLVQLLFDLQCNPHLYGSDGAKKR